MESFILFPCSMMLFFCYLSVVSLSSLLFCLSYCIVFSVGMLNFSMEGFELESALFFMDSISLLMALMSLVVMAAGVWASELELKEGGNWQGLSNCLQLTTFFCLVAFSCVGLMGFFMSYEMSVIPMVMMIMFWGSQPERVTAVLIMVIYTLLGSIPLLFCIMAWWCVSGTDSMALGQLMMSFEGEELLEVGKEVLIMGSVSFLVKLPMYGVHSWLPKAHVEAPVSGSMVLAGIMLKLGGYGLIRFMSCFSIYPNLTTNFIMVISVVGGFFASVACLTQSDLKRLIAFSSVGHMGMVLGGILSMGELGMKSSVLMMFGHGLSSPCLFYLMNEVSANRKSRSSVVCKGFLMMDPSISLVWFLMSSLNLGCPPSISYFSEVMISGSVLQYSYFLGVLGMISFLAGVFSMFLFSSINHGPKSEKMDFKGGGSRPLLVVMLCSLLSFAWFLFLVSVI